MPGQLPAIYRLAAVDPEAMIEPVRMCVPSAGHAAVSTCGHASSPLVTCHDGLVAYRAHIKLSIDIQVEIRIKPRIDFLGLCEDLGLLSSIELGLEAYKLENKL